MPKKSSFLRDCTDKCSSVVHAAELIAAVTLPRSSISDKQLASYLKSKCRNFHWVCDEFGRKVLHMAASCGRKELCQWLIKCYKVSIDDQDKESAYTSLHRAVLYGNIDVAVLLIQNDASLSLTDREDFTPVDLILKNFDREFTSFLFQLRSEIVEKSDDIMSSYEELRKLATEKRNLLAALSNAFTTEVYTWGTNQNYTLGFGADSAKGSPEYLEFFEKKNEIIIDIQMQKYHTLFLSLDGNVWSCGSGHGGRLGLPSDNTVLIPQKVTLTSKQHSSQCAKTLFCLQIAVGADHSIFMCNDNKGASIVKYLIVDQRFYAKLREVHAYKFDIVVSGLKKSSPILCSECIFISLVQFYRKEKMVGLVEKVILTCGLNTYHQLGISPPSSLVSEPELVEIKSITTRIIGIAASTFHSVIWTCNTVYTCGLHAGQLGRLNSPEKTVSTFQKIHELDFQFTKISHVAVSEAATVIATDANDIYLLSEYITKNMNSRCIISAESLTNLRFPPKEEHNYNTNGETVVKIAVFGGKLDMEKVKLFTSSYRQEPLRVAVLLSNGSLLLWRNNCSQFLKCDFLNKYEVRIADVHLNACSMLLCTYKGEVFNAQIQGSIKTFGEAKDDFVKVNHRSKEEIREYYLVKLMRIQSGHRSIRVFSEPSSSNYGLLKIRSASYLSNFPDIRSDTIASDIENFYRESCEFDSFSDVLFKVGRKSFPAHKYILASCSEELLSKEKEGIVVVENVDANIFEQLLLYVYTGSCCFLRDGPCPIEINKTSSGKNIIHNSPKSIQDPVKLSVKLAEEFKMPDYLKALRNFRYENNAIIQNSSQPLSRKRLRFNQTKFKNLYDVKLKSQDGKIFYAHKCILAARVEYFKGMFGGSWRESSDSYHEHAMPMNSSVLMAFVEFVYTDAVIKPICKRDFNFWCSLLVAADQFLLPKLVEICENAISQCLDTRNVCDVLMFANAIHAHQLKNSCYEFICFNLVSQLYSRTLEKLSDTLLNELTVYYRNQFRLRENLFSNPLNVPVYRNACSPEEVSNAENICPVDWDAINDPFVEKPINCKPLKIIQKKKKKQIRKPTTSESDNTVVKEPKVTVAEEITSHGGTVSSIEAEKTPTSEWMTVDKHLKSVKTRLRVNAAAKSCPQLIEHKENYTPLGPPKTSPLLDKLEEQPDKSSRTRILSFEIDLQNITPKLSQKQKKKLLKSNEVGKFCDLESSTQNEIGNDNSPPGVYSCHGLNNVHGSCWGKKTANSEAINFSAIVASEKKLKTMVQKETKKLEIKSLHLTQIEDKAIQELIAFYDSISSAEERIFVRRVIHRTAAPQWVTK